MSAINKRMDLSRTNSICPSPDTLLLEKVKNNDLEGIRAIVTANKSLLNYEYPYTSKTILSTACSEEEVRAETIQTLIDLGADIAGNAEWKPLHLAAQNPNSEILEVIINNIKLDQINERVEGNTALHFLIKSQNIKKNQEVFCRNVELLLKGGINVNQSDNKNLSAVFWAAKHGYKHILRTILEKSVNRVDLDSHVLRNKTARDLIKEKNLYSEPLPERILYQIPKEKIFALIKQGKEDEFIDYFETLSLTCPNDFVNLDDGTFTLLQYSCEKGLTKVVKYLLERGANVNLTTRNQERKPIDIVVENGYHEIFEVLVNQQNLEMSPNLVCSLIKGIDTLKFDKIDHEKCCSILLKKIHSDSSIVDINGNDNLTNTPIHYSLRYADEATTRILLKLGASLACKNKFGIMPIEDMKPDLLKSHLDECVKFNIKNKNDEKRDFEVVFDYHSLVPPSKFRRCKFDDSDPENLINSCDVLPETEVIAYMSQAPEFKALLKHPVIVSFLFLKWHRIRFLFYTNLLFYILFVVSLITYIFTYYSNFSLEKSSDVCFAFGHISWFLLNLTFWILFLRELFQITVSPGNYFQNFENFVEIILIIITAMILYVKSPTDDLRKQLASIAILLAAFELVLMVGQHPKLSTNVVMLKTVSINFFKLLLWYSLLIIAFALSFYILFTKTKVPGNINGTDLDEKDDLFMGPGTSLFKTIVMLTGEFDAGSINFHTYPITSKLIFSLFVFTITIILLNLLNGLAVSDTQTIKNDAELVGHITRAQHIYYVETMLLGNILPISLMKCVQNLFCCFPCNKDISYFFFKPLARRICLFNRSQSCQLTVLPNNHGKIYYEFDSHVKISNKSFVTCTKSCSEAYLDKETVKRINTIVKIRRELDDNSANNYYIICRNCFCKTKLEEILGKLTQSKIEL